MIPVHIIQLLDGDRRQSAFAEQDEAVLIQRTHQPHMQTKDNLTLSNSPIWPLWILAESRRRTILISHIFRGFYSYIKLDFCKYINYMLPLLLTAQVPQWDGQMGNTLQLVEQPASLPQAGVVLYFCVDVGEEEACSSRNIRANASSWCKGEECVDILESELLSQRATA